MLVNIIQNTISSFISAGEAAAHVITTNLKMWLGFETSSIDGDSQITPDKSGNNNVGELFTGKALEFDGSTTYVSANSFAGTLSNNTAFTFAIWFNSDKIATDYFRNILISSGGPQQFTNIFKIGVNPQTSATGSANVGGIYFDDSAGAYNNVVPLSGGVNYNDGEWHRLVVSRPQGSGNQTLTFYVDGSSIGTAPCNPYWNNVNLFDFGQEWDGGGTSDHFAGMMSNIQVYDYAWTTDDVTYDYANPNKLAIDNPSTSLSVTNLKAYWALSEGDGFVAYDSGTNLEEDVVINGDFATDSVWGKGAGWTITNGKARNDGTAGNNNLSQGGLLEVGKSYQITIEVSDFVSGIVEVSAGGSPRGTMTANGTYTFNQVASGTVFYIISKTFNGSVDNVSVREVTASDHGGLINGADYVDAQPRIPQLGMMNWAKSTPVSDEVTLIPNPTIPTQDILGNAVRDRLNSFNLDGSGYAEVADDTDLDIGTGAFTMECWVKADFENTGSGFNNIFILGGEIEDTNTASISINSTKLLAYVSDRALTADSNYTIGYWYHVCVTRNGSNLCTLYIDAEAQADTETTSASITNTSTKLIGRDTLTSRFYKNLISDVRLYKGKALSGTEIENNFNAGLSAHTND